jgi:hypothetical protein
MAEHLALQPFKFKRIDDPLHHAVDKQAAKHPEQKKNQPLRKQ